MATILNILVQKLTCNELFGVIEETNVPYKNSDIFSEV